MSRPQIKVTSIAIAGAVGLGVACSAAPSGDPGPTHTGASTPAAAATGTPGTPKVLARFDGSFDSATKKLTFALHPSEPGVIVTEGSLSYGLGAGQVYLHTDPSSLSVGAGEDGEDFVVANVFPENGTGATISGFTVTIDSMAPAGSVGMANREASDSNFVLTGCSGASLPEMAAAPPCTLVYGDVPPNPSFPTPVLTMPGAWNIYSAGLGDFTFSGTVSSASDRRVKRNVRPLAEAMRARRAPAKKRRRADV
jgi:hypothetical protein